MPLKYAAWKEGGRDVRLPTLTGTANGIDIRSSVDERDVVACARQVIEALLSQQLSDIVMYADECPEHETVRWCSLQLDFRLIRIPNILLACFHRNRAAPIQCGEMVAMACGETGDLVVPRGLVSQLDRLVREMRKPSAGQIIRRTVGTVGARIPRIPDNRAIRT